MDHTEALWQSSGPEEKPVWPECSTFGAVEWEAKGSGQASMWAMRALSWGGEGCALRFVVWTDFWLLVGKWPEVELGVEWWGGGWRGRLGVNVTVQLEGLGVWTRVLIQVPTG